MVQTNDKSAKKAAIVDKSSAEDDFEMMFGDMPGVEIDDTLDIKAYKALASYMANKVQQIVTKDGLQSDPLAVRKAIDLLFKNATKALPAQFAGIAKELSIDHLVSEAEPKLVKAKTGETKVKTGAMNIWTWLASVTQIAMAGDGLSIKPLKRNHRYACKMVMSGVVNTFKTDALDFETWYEDLSIWDVMGEFFITAIVNIATRAKKVPHVVRGELTASNILDSIADKTSKALKDVIRAEWNRYIGE